MPSQSLNNRWLKTNSSTPAFIAEHLLPTPSLLFGPAEWETEKALMSFEHCSAKSLLWYQQCFNHKSKPASFGLLWRKQNPSQFTAAAYQLCSQWLILGEICLVHFVHSHAIHPFSGFLYFSKVWPFTTSLSGMSSLCNLILISGLILPEFCEHFSFSCGFEVWGNST